MKLDNYCPGCGGGAGNQGCSIARCSLQHGGMEYCYLCNEYPCEKYKGIDEFDSFITHRNQLKDMRKIHEIGIEQYNSELIEKAAILKHLLANYNDGRRKSFFCIAVNLLDLHDLKNIIEQINSKTVHENLTRKEKENVAVIVFQTVAENKNIILKLNKKQAKK
jgi:vacuolar-type H+-ATPase subunit I/STV1